MIKKIGNQLDSLAKMLSFVRNYLNIHPFIIGIVFLGIGFRSKKMSYTFYKGVPYYTGETGPIILKAFIALGIILLYVSIKILSSSNKRIHQDQNSPKSRSSHHFRITLQQFQSKTPRSRSNDTSTTHTRCSHNALKHKHKQSAILSPLQFAGEKLNILVPVLTSLPFTLIIRQKACMAIQTIFILAFWLSLTLYYSIHSGQFHYTGKWKQNFQVCLIIIIVVLLMSTILNLSIFDNILAS